MKNSNNYNSKFINVNLGCNYKDAHGYSNNRKILYEMGKKKVKRREIRDVKRRDI